MLKNVLKIFQMSEQYWGCLDKMSEVNFSPAETLQYPTGICLLPNWKRNGPNGMQLHCLSRVLIIHVSYLFNECIILY